KKDIKMTKNVLLEIGTEEIPSSYIAPALEQIHKFAADMLTNIGLKFSVINTYSTPRRLILLINDVAEKSEDKTQEFNGPSVKAGKDTQGNWTQAIIGFSTKLNVKPEQLLIKDTDKGQYFHYIKQIKGVKAETLLSEILPSIIQKIYFPKTMVWESSCMKFARPIRTIVAMYGDKVIKFSLANGSIKSSNKTIGLHTLTTKPIIIDNVDNYKLTLQNNCVLVDQEERRKRIIASINEVADTISSKAILDDELIDEVNQLVEFPTAVLCKFEEKYLKLPPEVLITCMKKKQKCFAIKDAQGKLTNYFIGIRNGKSENQHIVREGYQKVVVARLSDSEFFYDNDIKKSFESSLERLKGLIFQKEIGTVYEKLSRIKNLANVINKENNLSCDENKINKVVDLSKTDLVSEMVFEYPELQGIMGRIYSKVSGETDDISQAIEQHYYPLSASSSLPESMLATIISLSDKLDTLVADFAIGFEPSGSADPYGLRRMSIGIIRMIREFMPNADVEQMIDISLNNLPIKIKEMETFKTAKDRLIKFLWNRIENIYENEGFKFDEVKCVIIPCQKDGIKNLGDIKIKLEALQNLRKETSFESITTIFKRATNILNQAKKQNLNITGKVNILLLKEETEQKLYEQYSKIDQELITLLENKEYSKAIRKLNDIKPYLDSFFENVMVMCEDENLKLNRISLISYITGRFNSFVSLSSLQ
ncbi:MAG: glycine--tRNA ligase subunit beta, partial [Endomicrobiaceae bacterium]|nr:glycine--tRNA ligase subunit beta [Endomicrobiaceae bacterium]